MHLAPIFSASAHPNPARLRAFWSFGLYQALHLALFSQGAHNCSFALPIAFILGEEGMLFTRDFVYTMDPELSEMLEPWFALSPDDPMPALGGEDPLSELLAGKLELQVSDLYQSSAGHI